MIMAYLYRARHEIRRDTVYRCREQRATVAIVAIVLLHLLMSSARIAEILLVRLLSTFRSSLLFLDCLH